MLFDPRKIEAQLTLGEIYPEDMPRLACDALEAGYDSPAVLRMAILNNPSGWETDQILPAFLKETGMQLLTKTAASVRLAYDLALYTIESKQDALLLLPKIEKLCIAADYPKELLDFYSLSDEVDGGWGRSRDEARRDTHDALITFFRDYEEQHSIR